VPVSNDITASVRLALRVHAGVLAALGIASTALAWSIAGPLWTSFPAAVVAFSIVLSVFLGNIVLHVLTQRSVTAQEVLYGHTDTVRRQIEELFAMTDMLQAAEDHEDAGAVLLATAKRLLPEFSGALYVFNNSRDRLDLAKSWNASPGFRPGETLHPNHCWTLKRGKPHINDAQAGTLHCMHELGDAATVEIPMMARGQVYGLLILAIETEDAFAKLLEVRRVGRALADSMSLALSNISLREKLRTQSLRDPLTGLYNRRYMEDALLRYVSLSERSGSATSVMMIDLDNFKRLNDEHGHAKGDAVLRDVAGQLVAGLRPSDVIARYGGEELVVILPNCGIEDAALKAEMLRSRIEGLSEAHATPVTASFGLASVPETATGAADVIAIADAALYAAKTAGKNTVVCADRRADREDRGAPRLAATG
jgi:diguanylate cyclase (GGDEF)-like protein